MRASSATVLWVIAAGWAIFWAILYYYRPLTFPLIGVPAGLLIVAPLLVMNWMDRRKARQRRQNEPHNRR